MNSVRYVAAMALAGFLMPSVQARPATGVWKDDCKCYRSVVWGPELWVDTTYRVPHQNFQQNLDFWPLQRHATNQPLIIWAHPGGGTKFIPVQSDPENPTLYDKIIVPARANGFAVASLEYRHPVHNDYIVPAPHVDIGLAVQSIRAMADSLGIDPNNIFLMGGSQGTLVVWQGMQPDMKQPGADGPAGQSSLVNAVYGYDAQATYQGTEVADMFLVPWDRQSFLDNWLIEHPQDPLFGSAVSSVTSAAPPLIVKYERAYFNRLVTTDELTVHHPDFGLALCAAYVTAGIPDKCQSFELVPKDEDYAGAYPFFLSYMVGGNAGTAVLQHGR
jgi:acetyl esterase/lipase